MNARAKSRMAGLLIALAATVYLSTENKYVGSALFSFALFLICANGYKLFTGAVGFASFKWKSISELGVMLAYNYLYVTIVAFMTGAVNPNVRAAAEILIDNKMNVSIGSMFVKGILCGFCMYLAVRNNAAGEKNTFVRFAPIFLLVPVFILSGFEHSIADAGYMAAAGGMLAVKFIPRFLVIVAGNAVGALIIHGLDRRAA